MVFSAFLQDFCLLGLKRLSLPLFSFVQKIFRIKIKNIFQDFYPNPANAHSIGVCGVSFFWGK